MRPHGVYAGAIALAQVVPGAGAPGLWRGRQRWLFLGCNCRWCSHAIQYPRVLLSGGQAVDSVSTIGYNTAGQGYIEP